MQAFILGVVIEKAIRNAGLNLRSIRLYKYLQIFAYANAIDVIGQIQSTMKEAFIRTVNVVRKRNLQITKTKCMISCSIEHKYYASQVIIGPCKFQFAQKWLKNFL